MRKSLALLGCLAVIAVPASASANQNYDSSQGYNSNQTYSSTTTTTTSNCAVDNCGYYYGYEHHVDPRVAYRHYGEYVVNPLEMTNTRDNRANIPGGNDSITNYREYRGEEAETTTAPADVTAGRVKSY